MDMQGFFRIGEVADMFHLSVSSLRYYELRGILTPEYTDPESGYRYYSSRQFECLNTIRYLRMLDFSLDEIADFLQNRDVDKMAVMLKQQQEAARQKMLEWQRIMQIIGHRITRLAEAREPGLGGISVQTCPPVRIAQIQTDLHLRTYLDLETSIRELERGQEDAFIFLGKVGVGISPKHLESEIYDRYDTAFLLLDPEDRFAGSCITLPQADCVCLRFNGSHPEAPQYYAKMMQYIRANRLTITGFSREITLIDDGMTTHREDYVTEIRIPVS